MKTTIISYANKGHYKNQRKLARSARKFGIDEIISYTEKDLKATIFYEQHKEILDQKRGGGYWLWKPYYILKTLKKMDKGGILIYSDSGVEITASLDPLIKICIKKGILPFSVGQYINKFWTKRDCFVLTDCDSEYYWNSRQYTASFILFKNSKQSRDFVSEWLNYCMNKNILTDIPNACGLSNLPEFKDHRHDQSILSLLAKKHNVEMFRDPSQWGNPHKRPSARQKNEMLPFPYSDEPFLNSPYGTLLNHHRRRSLTLKRIFTKLKKILKSFYDK